MADMILVINAGSSSLKFKMFSAGAPGALTSAVQGQIDGIGTHPKLAARDSKGVKLVERRYDTDEVRDLPAALVRVQAWLSEHLPGVVPIAVGHRLVHGGPTFAAPVLIDDVNLPQLERLIPLAPLHLPNNLAPIKALRQWIPQIKQVACFDTAFHRGRSEVAQRFAIPEILHEEGVRRYGFHGLSYEYISSRLPMVAPEIADKRVIVAHLGSGASMCAMIDCKSVETTMGFTALDGLPMGTRPGQLDAGVVLYLMSERRMGPKRVEHLLYHECGLKGLSGISGDVRDLLASADPRAALALDVFTYRLGLLAASLAAAMGGVDGFVFTAGIGENSPDIRERAADRLAWLGLELDRAANRKGRPLISTRGSRIACYVIPTDEELMIGRHTLSMLRALAQDAQGATPRILTSV